MLSEGPHWDYDENVLYYVDIQSQTMNRYDPDSGEVTLIKLDGGKVTLVVPVYDAPGKFIVSRGRDLLLLNWDGTNKTATMDDFSIIGSVEADKDGNRFNDGKADLSGRMWAGTMGPEPVVGMVIPFQGGFYSFDVGSNEAVQQLTKVSISNGLAWNADHSILYYIDTPTRRVDKFDYDIKSGKISYRRSAFVFDNYNVTGNPDGMTIDADGNLWVACFGGSQVIHVDPRSGELLHQIPLPAERVTSTTFGGKNMDILYVTTSRFGLTDDQLAKQPDAGSVFKIEGLGIRGTVNNKAVRST